MTGSTTPVFDAEVRQRLGRRFGPAVHAWFDALTPRLEHLAARWRLDLGPLIRRGTVSVVVSCRAEDGSPLVLKVSPDRERIDTEGEALAAWRTRRVPRVVARDPALGALLLEGIRPGLALDQSDRLPSADDVGSLLRALHDSGPAATSVPSLETRVRALFDAGEGNYMRRPELVDVVPRALYDAGRRAAMSLTHRRAVGCRPASAGPPAEVVYGVRRDDRPGGGGGGDAW